MEENQLELIRVAVEKGIESYYKKREEETLNLPVEKLGFSKRVMNVFRDNEINTIGDIIDTTENEMKQLRNFGKHCIDEVKYKLSELNLKLK